MSNLQTNPDSFSRAFQRHFIYSYVIGMPDVKLKHLAMYLFNDSRTELAYRTMEMVSGDVEAFDDFLFHFPLSWRESLALNKRVLQSALETDRFAKTKTKRNALNALPAK